MNKLRFFLLKLLVGNSVVCINAFIDGKQGIVIKGQKNNLIHNCTLSNFNQAITIKEEHND